MVDVMEVTIGWQSPKTRGGTSVLHFAGDDPSAVRAALYGALTETSAYLNSFVQWNIANEGRFFEAETGTLNGAWADSDPGSGSGTGSGEPVPNASQLLLRLNTNTIVAGRFVHGRTFVPGLIVEATDDGEVRPAVQLAIRDAWDATYIAATQPVVWSRPIDGGRPGSLAPVSSISVWNELAVLRRRR